MNKSTWIAKWFTILASFAIATLIVVSGFSAFQFSWMPVLSASSSSSTVQIARCYPTEPEPKPSPSPSPSPSPAPKLQLV